MKRSLVILLLIFSGTINTFAQEQTNKDRIEDARKEMEAAAAKQDYSKAAELQREIEIREKIEEAVTKGDYAEAQRLKEELSGEKNQSSTAEKKTDAPVTSGNGDGSTYYNSPGFHPPAEGKAVVYIARVTRYAWAVGFEIFLKEEIIGKVAGSEYIRLELDPGEHVFWASSENKAFVTANVEAGNTYFIVVDVKMGWIKAKVGLNPVNPHEDELIDRVVELVEEKPASYLPKSNKEKIMMRLNERGFIEDNLNKYRKNKDDYPRLSADMNIPEEELD